MLLDPENLMPQMANILIKAANGTGDVLYVAATPSAGDKVAARWTVPAAHSKPAMRPTLSIVTSDNGPKTARTVDIQLNFPIVETVNGVDVVVARVPAKFHMVLPTNADVSSVKEPAYQIGNLLSAALVRSVFESGYSPT